MISLPEGLSSTNPMQQAFIDALLKNSDLQFGADLINGDLQTVIGSITRCSEDRGRGRRRHRQPGGDRHARKSSRPLRREGWQGRDSVAQVSGGERMRHYTAAVLRGGRRQET